MGNPFRVEGHFQTSAPSDPKITLYTNRPKVSHRCSASTTESQISIRFTLWPTVFKLHTPFVISAPKDSKSPWTLQCERYPMYMSLVSLNPKFKLVSLYGQLFSIYIPFWVKWHQMTPKWPWTLRSQRYPMYILLVSLHFPFGFNVKFLCFII